MIAIVILGLGLIMVATMFPVAWQRARTLGEYTIQTTVTQSAHATLKMLAAVDGLDTHAGTFAGDLIFDNAGGGRILALSDTRVHALNMGNVIASAPRRFIHKPTKSWDDGTDRTALWRLGRPDFINVALADLCDDAGRPGFCDPLYVSKQIEFESLVYPPLERRDVSRMDLDGMFIDDDPRWDDALEKRRFSVAILHRLREEVDPTPDGVNQTREFDIYYVTLRRPQPTLRYARQNPDLEMTPNPLARAVVVTPVALPPEQDVMFPSPWRVQVYFPAALASTTDPANLPSGVPTEVEVNTLPVATAEFVVDVFQRGTQFIDEITGAVYRVVNRRIAQGTTGTMQDQAFLTLGREVFIEDIDDSPETGGSNSIELDESIRTVWVFPPPVDAERNANDEPVFVGKQPTVGIEIRKLTLTPAG